MSLLDTIKGAREEAQEAGTLLGSNAAKKDKTEVTSTTDEASEGNTGFSRRSTARAKPKREVAGSVRTSASAAKDMTKEERKAQRKAQQNEDDLRRDVAESILKEQPGYVRNQRIWWACVIAGMACAAFSWLIMRSLQNDSTGGENLAMFSIALMVIAYVLVIGAFIFDMVKVRPMRNAASEKVVGLSKRRLQKMAAESAEAAAEKKNKK